MSVYIALPLALLPFVILVCLMLRYQRTMLKICSVFVVGGFLIYTGGYVSAYLAAGGGFADMIFAVLRGILSTARMFSINEDYKDLTLMDGTDWMRNTWIGIALWCCHISVIVLLQTALVFWFGRKLIAGFRLRFWPDDEIYVIKGCDKKALLLGENIATRDDPLSHPVSKRVVVFLLSEDDDEKRLGEKVANFGGVVYVLDRKHDFTYYLKKVRLGKRIWPVFGKEKKYNIILMPDDTCALDDVRQIVKYANEKKCKPENLDIFVFTSLEWDREKIEAITQEKIEAATQGKAEKKRKYPYTIHIVNEADLVVRRMIEKRHPVNCPAFKFKDGVTRHNFTVMMVGFGALGQTALLRLVMNGQFVGSRMRAIVVDRNIDKYQEYFLHRFPGLKICCDMEFHKVDVHSDVFFKLLDESGDIDYMVIALHLDKANKQTALDVRFHYDRGIRDGQKKDGRTVIAVSENWRSLYEANQDEERGEDMFVFGQLEDIYKESIIIRGKIDLMAKAVNEVYNSQSQKKKSWTERSWFEQESSRASADFVQAQLVLAGVDEKNVSGILVDKDSPVLETLAQTEHLRWNAFHAAMGWRPISIEEMREIYKRYNDPFICQKDGKTRSHLCFAPWGELGAISEAYERITGNKEDFKQYDYRIVENVPEFLKKAKETIQRKGVKHVRA